MFDLQHQSVASSSSSPHSSSFLAASPTSSSGNMHTSSKEQQDSVLVLSPSTSQEKVQLTSKEQLDCTADVLAFALKQDDMSPLPFTSGHQGFASNREYSTVSNDESRMAFSPKPSHNLASSSSKEQLDCTADVLALASRLGEMSPLPFLKPRTTLFRKPKAQVAPQSPGLSAKPGKNWRRSLAAAKRNTLTSTNTSFATSRLSMVPSKLKRDTLALTNASFATSRLSTVSGSLRTRSSFFMAPTKASTAPGSPKVQDKVSKLLEGLSEDEGETEEETNEVEGEESLACLSLAETGKKPQDVELLAVCSGGKVVKFEEIYTEEVMER